MSREQYLLEIKNISEQIYKLSLKRRDLTSDFLNKNSLYSYGEKVAIKRKDGIIEGFIGTSKVDGNGFVVYEIKAVKKDGTMSTINLFYDFEFNELSVSKIK